jgi:hypothetical protein
VIHYGEILSDRAEAAVDSPHAVKGLPAAAIVDEVPVDPQQRASVTQLADDMPGPELVE